MVYVEIKDIARKYGVWRKKELEKHKSVGKTLHNAAPPLKILSWKEWKGKADKATKELLEDMRKGNTIDFNKEVWKTFKNFLMFLFHGKCAYCEGRYAAGCYSDVEHYRPKAKVTLNRNDSCIVKIVSKDGKEVPHPGYYWLVYDPKNLLLACERCNQEGKKNQFPIRGTRANSPGDSLNNELPLLLNPYLEKRPGDHFHVFDEKSGFLEGKTEEGKRTIEICNLYREDLVTARQEEWEKMKKELLLKLANDVNQSPSQLVPDHMEFSLYLRLAMETAVNKMAAGFVAARKP